MSPYRIVSASELVVGPATVVVRLPDRTIRSRVVMVAAEPHGIVRVAFACGEILAFDRRACVGIIDRSASSRRRRVGT